VDDYDHKLYKALGFSRFDETIQMDRAGELLGAAPKTLSLVNLGVNNLWKYVTRFVDMVPTEGNVDWSNLPEGGLRNGGTLVVKGENVVYQWSDTVPSDVPNVADVVQIAQKATMKD